METKKKPTFNKEALKKSKSDKKKAINGNKIVRK
jgi:hypothetical protein